MIKSMMIVNKLFLIFMNILDVVLNSIFQIIEQAAS